MQIYFTQLPAQWLYDSLPTCPPTHIHRPLLSHLQAFYLGALVLQLGLQFANLSFLPADQRLLHHWLLLELQLVLHWLELCGETSCSSFQRSSGTQVHILHNIYGAYLNIVCSCDLYRPFHIFRGYPRLFCFFNLKGSVFIVFLCTKKKKHRLSQAPNCRFCHDRVSV